MSHWLPSILRRLRPSGDRPLCRSGVGLAMVTSALLPALCGAAAGEPPPTSRETKCDRPSVILYVVDTLRADGVGSYGSRVQTPFMDRLAQEGTSFENALAPSSWTRASIGSILTGLYPDVHGAEGRNDALPAHVATLAELFSQQGYQTAAVVANPNVGSFYGFDQGFSEFVQLYRRRSRGMIGARESIVPSDQVTERVIEWLATASCPFFLFALTIDPHAPYAPPVSFDRYGAKGYSGPADDELAIVRNDLNPADRQRLRSLYDGEISFNDDSIGKLLSWLDDSGLDHETAVVLTSDHGEEFWEHGGVMHGTSLFQETLRVPLIIRYPKSLPGAKQVSRPVSLVDIAPTLLELAGIPTPYALDGASLLAPLANERVLYSTLELDRSSVRAVTRSPWKLIWNRSTGTRRLYNLELDAGESKDLSETHADRAAELGRAIDARIAANSKRQAELRDNAPVRSTREEDLPPDARKALEALGYIESE